jgi:hypothetical protein
MSGGWSRTRTGDLTFMRRLLYLPELSSLLKNLVGALEDTYTLAPRTRAVAFCRAEP